MPYGVENMEYLNIKDTTLRVSRLCMGGCPLGGYGWGRVQERELLDAVRTALDNGINFFDTADIYGLGTSELTLGKALGSRRAEAVVATKFGVRVDGGKTWYDNSPSWMEQALTDSLRRLGTDWVDLWIVHYLDGVTPLEDIVEALERYRQEGRIRAYGLSNVTARDLERIAEAGGGFVSLQDEYSLACRKNEEILTDSCARYGLTPMTWGSLGQGVLTGKYDITTIFGPNDRRSREVYINFHGEKFRHNLRIVEAMRPIAAAHNVPLAAVAVRFILDHLPDSVVLTGFKRPAQVLDTLKAMDWRLTAKELQELDNISLEFVSPDGETHEEDRT